MNLRDFGRRSYSMEAEDLLLDTVLAKLRGHQTPGTYLDIGSAHPVEHSNTYYFYERGWRGICVEPNPEFFALYSALRPEDRALNIGISDHASGNLRYHRFAQPLINGFFGQAMLDIHAAHGETYLDSIDVPCMSINDFLTKEVTPRNIDILNIDVETLESYILTAWDWKLCRPAVICAEIHTASIETMLQSDVAIVMKRCGYTPVSRGWLSAIFVASELIGS